MLLSDGLVPFSSITSINKKRKQDKEARLAKVMVGVLFHFILEIKNNLHAIQMLEFFVMNFKEGREGRGKFGQRCKDSRLGKSNKEKMKNKSFMMIRHKANKKQKRSFKDKQVRPPFSIRFLCDLDKYIY